MKFFIHVTLKIDINGNTVYRCRANSRQCRPLTIKSAYSSFDAAQCYIRQTMPNGYIITTEAPGFDDKSELFIVEAI
jgi:hypothetical protein